MFVHIIHTKTETSVRSHLKPTYLQELPGFRKVHTKILLKNYFQMKKC